MTLLNVNNLKKVYNSKNAAKMTQALDNITFSVDKGEYVAIMGESGSGKTTLLNLLAALDTPTSGQIILDGQDIAKMKDSQMADFRRDDLGFVFQEFNLLDTFTLEENIFLPLVLSGIKHHEMSRRLFPIAKRLGIEPLLKKYPNEVSGGQKQRAAVARALINNPKIILADEPTGALDSKASEQLLGLFKEINQMDQTILMVTHSIKAASSANRVIFIKDGKIFHQIYRGDWSDEQMYQKISDALIMLGEAK